MKQTIVGEASVNWALGNRPPNLISDLFETMVNVNDSRGYDLCSWQLDRVVVNGETINETIVAVFELRGAKL